MTRERSPYHRGDVLWIQCDPSLGVEPRKLRTCVVVSNDSANRHGQAVTVVPTQTYTTERAGRAYMVDLRAPRSDLRDARVANASMIMTYDRARVVRRAGRLAPEAVVALDDALRVHLALIPVSGASARSNWFSGQRYRRAAMRVAQRRAAASSGVSASIARA